MVTSMYDCIRVDSMDTATIERCVTRAEQLQVDVCFLSTTYSHKTDLDTVHSQIQDIDTNITLKLGAIVKRDKAQPMTKAVKSAREHADMVMVAGGNLVVQSHACRMPEVDVIDTPYAGRKDSGMDHVLAQTATANNVAIGVHFNDVQYSYGKRRLFTLTHIRTLVALCQKYQTPYICYSLATSPWEMHSPRDMAALLNITGMSVQEALHAVIDYPEAITERSETVNLQDFVRPGIRRESS